MRFIHYRTMKAYTLSLIFWSIYLIDLVFVSIHFRYINGSNSGPLFVGLFFFVMRDLGSIMSIGVG